MWPRPSLVAGIATSTCCALLLLLMGGASAQEAAPDPPDAPPAPEAGAEAPKAAAPPGTNFRFRETHGAPSPQEIAKVAPQYRVAVRETITTEVAKAKGAKPVPPRKATRSAVWTERVAALDPFYKDVVTAVVRQYEANPGPAAAADGAAPAPAPAAAPDGAPSLDGLTLWVQYRPGQAPLLINLDENRELTDRDYRWIATQPFPPQLSSLLPVFPQRIGDGWRLSPNGVEALLLVPVEFSDLNAKLISVKPAEGGVEGRQVAEFGFSGKAVRIDGGEVALNARLDFEFSTDTVGNVDAAELMNAYGAVTHLSLALSQSMPGPRRGDPATIIKRQLTLERRLSGDAPSLELPPAPPAATPANSWLTFESLREGWKLRHPQDYQPQLNPETGGIDFVAHREVGTDVLSLKVEPKAKLDAEKLRRDRIERWRKDGQNAEPGALSNLAAEQWPGTTSASRFSATLKAKARPRDEIDEIPPISFWGYVLNYSEPPAGIYAEAMTMEAEGNAFVDEVEEILRTFRAGEPGAEPAAPAANAAPAPARRGGTNPQTPPLSIPSGPTVSPGQAPVVEPPQQ